MPTQIENLKDQIAALEASNGADAPFAKLLRQQLAGMELNKRNKSERFLMSTGSPEKESSDPQVETEADSIKAEAVRRERVRRMAADASLRFPATRTGTSKAPQGQTPGSSK